MTLTKERIAKAYEVSGIRPITNSFAKKTDTACYGCILTAIAIAECGLKFDDIARDSSDIFNAVAEVGIHEELASGVVSGWDGLNKWEWFDEEKSAAYDLARELRDEIADDIQRSNEELHAWFVASLGIEDEEEQYEEEYDEYEDDDLRHDYDGDEDDMIWNDPNDL